MSTTVDTVFGASEFMVTAGQYGKDTKVKRIIDALCSCSDSREDSLAAALAVIEQLETMADEGVGYTPDRSLGFGSDSAAVIAEKLLGRTTTVGATRKQFAKLAR